MPYKSKAQQRRFHSDPKLMDLAAHWDDATKKTKGGFAKLPEKIKKKKTKSKTKNERKRKT